MNRALAGTDFVVYRSTADETVTREMALVDRFCRTVHSVHALLEGRRACRRAVFLDDCLPDARSISKVYDMLKLAGARVMVIACLGQSIKAPEAHRRAAEVVRVRYPAPPVTAEHILVAFRDGQASPEAARRCAEAAGGCVPKAEQLLRSELYGTRAVEALRGVDTTIFEDVARAVALARRGRPFPDVEVAISNEPSLSAMILRESLPRPSPGTRDAFRMLSRTPPGAGHAFATCVFVETCLRERGALDTSRLRFPRCYTTTSSRTVSLRKRAAAEAAGHVRHEG